MTFFVRIDAEVEKDYHSATWFFEVFEEELTWLQRNGHQLGWHFHSLYPLHKHEEDVIHEIRNYEIAAKKAGVTEAFRIGNSIMTNGIMECLENIGVLYECSALPRPHYPWIQDDILWERTGQFCYYPSRLDYQTSGEKRRILEVPMSTSAIPASYDSRPGVLRYFNPAYRSDVFLRAVAPVERDVTMIFHPHELTECRGRAHELLAYSAETLKENLRYLATRFQCVTIRDYAHGFLE